MDRDLERAADLILAARHALAFTGAGISTPSGIPDYRSPGAGLWETMDAMKVATSASFRADPAAFYRLLRPLAARLLLAEPNAAHRALADLEQWGLLACIITQNVDNLHQKAGSRCVWELHGHLRQATCLRCQRTFPAEGLLEDLLQGVDAPRCSCCGGALKPNVVFFGEPLPRYAWMEAAGEAERCDLILVVGSSLEVTPASDLPFMALRHGAKIVVINNVPTPLDEEAAVVLCDDLAVVLPRLAEACRLRLGTERRTR